MRVLAIKSPWSERIVKNDKTIEVRSRITHINGRVAIYSTMTKPNKTEVEWIEGLGYSVDDSLRGHVIGTVEIYDAYPVRNADHFHDNLNKHLCYQDMYKKGQHFWYLRNAQRITPVPYKMKSGTVVWGTVDDELINEASLK
jgi:hypothetical protein